MTHEHFPKTPHTVDLMPLENNTTNPRNYLVRRSQYSLCDTSPHDVRWTVGDAGSASRAGHSPR